MMRLRIAGGPTPTSLRVEDIDSGLILPAYKVTLAPILPRHMMMTATVEVPIEMLDIEVEARQEISLPTPHGPGVTSLTFENGRPVLAWRSLDEYGTAS